MNVNLAENSQVIKGRDAFKNPASSKMKLKNR